MVGVAYRRSKVLCFPSTWLPILGIKDLAVFANDDSDVAKGLHVESDPGLMKDCMERLIFYQTSSLLCASSVDCRLEGVLFRSTV
jgi:hypothetical protein